MDHSVNKKLQWAPEIPGHTKRVCFLLVWTGPSKSNGGSTGSTDSRESNDTFAYSAVFKEYKYSCFNGLWLPKLDRFKLLLVLIK